MREWPVTHPEGVEETFPEFENVEGRETRRDVLGGKEGAERFEGDGAGFAICQRCRSATTTAVSSRVVFRASMFPRHSPLDAKFLMNGMGLSCEAMATGTAAWLLWEAGWYGWLTVLGHVTGVKTAADQ